LNQFTSAQIDQVSTILTTVFLNEAKKTVVTDISEYDCFLPVKEGIDYSWEENSLLNIYQKHFIIRHCAYQLQTEFARKHGLHIAISVTGFSIRPLKFARKEILPDTDHAQVDLRDFYNDFENLYCATPESVATLLASFWEKYQSMDKKPQALKILDLPSDAKWADIQKKYRELAQRHHPDRGGNDEFFIAIRDAYTLLKSTMK